MCCNFCSFPIYSLEYHLQNLQKCQMNMNNDNNNVVTITTGHSLQQTNNNPNNHDDFYHARKQFVKQPSKVTTNSNGTSTINLIGPVTDL